MSRPVVSHSRWPHILERHSLPTIHTPRPSASPQSSATLPSSAVLRRGGLAAARALIVLVALGAAAPSALAQPVEDESYIVEKATSLRNPTLARRPIVLFVTVQKVLQADSRRADDVLRAILGDLSDRRIVAVEQIMRATIVGPHRRLLPEIVERLRIEGESETALEAYGALGVNADSELSAALTELVADTERAVAFRGIALRMLWRTGRSAAVAVLADYWEQAEPDLKAEAALGFQHLVPGVTTPEQARAYVQSFRDGQFPEREALRTHADELWKVAQGVPEPREVPDQDYYEASLLALLPRATLDQVIEIYLDPRSLTLCEAGVLRLADFPFKDGDEIVDRRRAGETLLQLLPVDLDERVELAVIETLGGLTAGLKGYVNREQYEQLSRRVKRPALYSRGIQRATIRFVGRLEDERGVTLLQERFDSLRDTDPILRLEILSALAHIKVPLTDWLILRAGGADGTSGEADKRVLVQLLAMLRTAKGDQVTSLYRRLLEEEDQDGDVQSVAVKGLGNLWTHDQLPAARAALVELGLKSPEPLARQRAAEALGAPSSAGGDDEAVVSALLAALDDEQLPGVREAIASAVIALDLPGSTWHLLGHFRDPRAEIWRIYRERLLDDAVSNVDPIKVLDAADLLAKSELGSRAMDLLGEAAKKRPGLWPATSGERAVKRGSIRARLVEELLVHGGSREALPIARELAETVAQKSDPELYWRFLLARTLRQLAGPDVTAPELGDAKRELEALVKKGALLEPALLARVLYELAALMATRGDYAYAVDVLERLDALTGEIPSDVVASRAATDEAWLSAAAKERDNVTALIDDLVSGDPVKEAAADQALQELGPRAALHVRNALPELAAAPSVIAPPQRKNVLRLLSAARVVARKSFVAGSTVNDQTLREAVKAARKALDKILKGRWSTW